jgi:hypothetical protein
MSVTVYFGPGREFTRRSDADSICMSCFRTVRTDRHTSLGQAEQDHCAVCQPLQPIPHQIRRAS